MNSSTIADLVLESTKEKHEVELEEPDDDSSKARL